MPTSASATQPGHQLFCRGAATIAVGRGRGGRGGAGNRATISRGPLGAKDFPPAFFVVALISATSLIAFLPLPGDAGAKMSGHTVSRGAKENVA